jgi:membrane protein YdbS with pleckstrin-like domain
MTYFDKHLDSDEKILYRCRPARRTFMIQYLLVIISIVFALISAMYRLMFWLNTAYDKAATFTWIVFFFIILAVLLLIRIEYKIWSKRYALTTERLMISKGIFSEDFRSTVYNKVTDIGLRQSFIDKILNTGTITLNTAGGDNIEIMFENISRPFDIKKMISDKQSEKIRHVSTVMKKRKK